jgi:hypothetical protein
MPPPVRLPDPRYGPAYVWMVEIELVPWSKYSVAQIGSGILDHFERGNRPSSRNVLTHSSTKNHKTIATALPLRQLGP